MLKLTGVLMACRLLSINESCAIKLIAMLVPGNLFWEDGFPLEKINLKKKKKENLKLKHIEIGSSKVIFFVTSA